jgi:hypothetical protein
MPLFGIFHDSIYSQLVLRIPVAHSNLHTRSVSYEASCNRFDPVMNRVLLVWRRLRLRGTWFYSVGLWSRNVIPSLFVFQQPQLSCSEYIEFSKILSRMNRCISELPSELPWPLFLKFFIVPFNRLCGLVVRVPGYRSRNPDLIPGATRFSEK